MTRNGPKIVTLKYGSNFIASDVIIIFFFLKGEVTRIITKSLRKCNAFIAVHKSTNKENLVLP